MTDPETWEQLELFTIEDVPICGYLWWEAWGEIECTRPLGHEGNHCCCERHI